MAPNDDRDLERSWPEYRRLVLGELVRIDKGMNDINLKLESALALRDKGIGELQIDVAMLKIKASLFGALCGGIATMGIQVIGKFGFGH